MSEIKENGDRQADLRLEEGAGKYAESSQLNPRLYMSLGRPIRLNAG